MQDTVRREFNNVLYALELLPTEYLKVHTAVAQSISSQVLTKLVFGTVDHGGNWATNRYTVPTNGLYLIQGSIRTTGTARGLRLMVYKNGILYAALTDAATNSVNFPMSHGSTDIWLVAGDYIELWIFSSAATTIASSMDCNLCIRRVA